MAIWHCQTLLCIARSVRLRGGGNLSLFQPAGKAKGADVGTEGNLVGSARFSKEQSLFHQGRMWLTRKFHDNRLSVMNSQLIKHIFRESLLGNTLHVSVEPGAEQEADIQEVFVELIWRLEAGLLWKAI